MKTLAVIIGGGPGSGKSTQSKLLECYFHSLKIDALHISTGDIIRSEDSNDPEIILSKEKQIRLPNLKIYSSFEKYLKRMVAPRMADLEIIIIDGMPREIGQTNYLMKNFSVKKVYFLDVPDEVLDQRMIFRGREADKHPLDRLEKVINYKTKTIHALHHFPSKLVTQINGKLPRSIIHEMIKEDTKSYL